MAIYKNKAGQKLVIYAYDVSAGEAKTGDAANITAEISKDAAASAPTNDTNPTELEADDHPGVYIFNLTQAETNADLIVVSPVSSTADIVIEPIIIYTQPEVREVAAAGVRTALGMSTANLDNQLAAIVTDTGTTLPSTLAAIVADTNELQTDWVDGGRLDLLLDGATGANISFLPYATRLFEDGSITPYHLIMYQGANINVTLIITDAAGDPVDLSAVDLKFMAWTPGDTADELITLLSTGGSPPITVSGDGNNAVTIRGGKTQTAALSIPDLLLQLSWQLVDTAGEVYAGGPATAWEMPDPA